MWGGASSGEGEGTCGQGNFFHFPTAEAKNPSLSFLFFLPLFFSWNFVSCPQNLPCILLLWKEELSSTVKVKVKLSQIQAYTADGQNVKMLK